MKEIKNKQIEFKELIGKEVKKKMISQVTNIDGEKAIKTKPEWKLKYGDMVKIVKINKSSHTYKRLPTELNNMIIEKKIKKELK
jgi:hypothetical protein